MPPRSGRCLHSRCLFIINPCLKHQRYCGRSECQRVRKRLCQPQKMATDADCQQNQRGAQKHWQQEHPDYWRHYRERHPDYAENNCRLQHQRDHRRRSLVKMDASGWIKRI